MKVKKLFLLDVFPILYRSHFAMMQQHLKNSAGLNTSAILGFCNYLFLILFKEKPTHIAAAFDYGSAVRSNALSFYKANRERMPDKISMAKTYIKTIIDALNIKTIELEGYEADDVIGTIAVKAEQKGFDVFIVSPDKDFGQVVSDKVFLYRPSYKGVNFEVLDAAGIKSKYGVPPEQIPDLLALQGDAADNIPGVPKIGEKTALELLKQFNSVEDILENKLSITKESIKKTLIENEDQAILCKHLALIDTKLPINFSAESFALKAPETEELVNVLDELEFTKLKERIFNSIFYKKAFEARREDNIQGNKKSCVFKSITDGVELNSLVYKIKNSGKFYFISRPHKEFLDIWFSVESHIYTVSWKGKNIPASVLGLFENEQVEKITFNIKGLFKYLLNHQLMLKGRISDVQLAAYLLSPDSNHTLERMAGHYLGVSFQEYSPHEKLCLEVRHLSDLYEKVFPKIKENKLIHLYEEIDLPLASVLAKVERHGIKMDTQSLSELSISCQEQIEGISEKIYHLSGVRFNLRSNKQTADVLSRMLYGSVIKKTPTGQISTSEASLAEFAEKYEIADLILRHRRLSKLVSTYTENLPGFIDSKTGRIHADFLQTTTGTGRLSCQNPNLQNLPIRLEEGREVRKAVIPENDEYVILSADYSQIELRLLASLSQDEGLIKAFSEGEDVHTVTAAKVFNVRESEVTDDMRSKAKMVNYGIAYGISPFGLGQNLRISMKEAREIIDQYFSKFPGIKEFIEKTIDFASVNSFSETITGRQRLIEDINSKNGTERRAAERIAINAPIQGLAADIIKISMISIDKELENRKMASKMILQVHDELVFEVFKPELAELTTIVKNKMEGAIQLSVPLDVNIGVGANWLELAY